LEDADLRTPGSAQFPDGPALSRPGDPTLQDMLMAETLSLFTELGPARFSRLLDAIADNEIFSRADDGRLRSRPLQPHCSGKIRRRRVAREAQPSRFSWRKLAAATRTP
jgi:hypothetical protein